MTVRLVQGVGPAVHSSLERRNTGNLAPYEEYDGRLAITSSRRMFGVDFVLDVRHQRIQIVVIKEFLP